MRKSSAISLIGAVLLAFLAVFSMPPTTMATASAALPIPSQPMIPSGLARNMWAASSGWGTASSNVQTEGTVSVIVVCVDFPDRPHERSTDEINKLVFTDLNQYWQDVSYGKLSITGTTVGWYHSSTKFSKYADGDQTKEYAMRVPLMNEAGKLADPDVDFTKYDIMIVVHAGGDQAYTFKMEDFWSVGSIGRMGVTTNDGQVSIGVMLMAESDRLGPFAHEMGHTFGMVDLWNYNILKTTCPWCDDFTGEWDLMGHGFWANNGTTPTEPSAYTKIKFGWISDSQVKVAEKGSAQDATLTPLDLATGTKAVKIPVDVNKYYLVEVRRRIGWDLYLPDEGVIIYYIDEGLDNGKGPVRVQASVDMGKAAWKESQSFTNTKIGVGVYVKTIDKDFTATVTYTMGLTAGTFKMAIHVPDDSVSVKIDGIAYAVKNGTVSIAMAWGAHKVWVQDFQAVSDGARTAFMGWSDGTTTNPRTVLLTSDVTLKAIYKQQFRLAVSSPYPVTGDGWYDANTAATVEATNPIVDHGDGSRHIFSGWSGNATGTDNRIQVQMDSPKTVTADWKQQYRLTIESQYGNPAGANWYDERATVTISIEKTVDVKPGEREVFTGWSGLTETATNPGQTFTIMGPMTVQTNWTKQHLVQAVVDDASGKPVLQPNPLVVFSNGMTVVGNTEMAWIDAGTYSMTQITWHGVNITPSNTEYTTAPNQVWHFTAKVYSVQIYVTSILTGLPENGATATIQLSDGKVTADSKDGVITFTQVPQGSYQAVLSSFLFTQVIRLDVNQNTNTTVSVPVAWEFLAIGMSIVLVALLVFQIRRVRHSKREKHDAPPEPETANTPEITPALRIRIGD